MPILVPSVLLSPSVSHYCTVLYAFEPPAHLGRIGRLCLLQTTTSMYCTCSARCLWYLQPHLIPSYLGTSIGRREQYCTVEGTVAQYSTYYVPLKQQYLQLYCATALLPPNTTEDLRLRQLPLDSEQSSITVQQRLHHSCSTSQIFALPIIHPLYTRLLWPPALHYWLQAAGCPDCHNSCASPSRKHISSIEIHSLSHSTVDRRYIGPIARHRSLSTVLSFACRRERVDLRLTSTRPISHRLRPSSPSSYSILSGVDRDLSTLSMRH